MITKPAARDPELRRFVAEMYYERGLGLKEIAALTQLSVATVSRLRAQALSDGIVEIRVLKESDHPRTQLANRLEELLGTQFHVTPGYHSDPLSESLMAGAQAAEFAVGLLPQEGLVGWATGHTVSAMVESLGSAKLPSVDSVALIGGYDPTQPHLDANLLIRKFSEKNGGQAHVLNSPAWLATQEAKEAMMAHPVIMSTIRMWDEVDIAFVGSGMPPDLKANYFTVAERWTQQTRNMTIERGVVGDLLGLLFTIEGELVEVDGPGHLLCPTYDQIKNIPTVAVLLGGHSKVRTLIGMARTGLADVIITDEHCAGGALALLEGAVRQE